MKNSVLVSFLLLTLIAGASEPLAIFLFGTGLLGLGQLIKEQQKRLTMVTSLNSRINRVSANSIL